MFAIEKNQRHLCDFIFFVMIFFLWFLFAFNQWNGDRDGYELHYLSRSVSEWGVEIGYGYLNVFFRWMGFSYQEFQVVIATLCMLLLSRYIYHFSVVPFFVLFIYAIFFFPLDYVLIRSFLAFCIFLQGLFYLFKGNVSGRLLYFLIVLLASVIHQSALMLLLFVFIPLDRLVSFRVFLCVFSTFALSYFYAKDYLYLIDYYNSYMQYYQRDYKGGLYVFLVSILSAAVVFYSCKSISKKRELSGGSNLVRYSVFIYNINIYSLFFVFLYMEIDIFVRLHRVIDFLNITYICTMIFYDSRNILFYIAYLVFLLFFLFSYFIIPVFDMTFIPIFFNNVLLRVL